MAIRELHPTTQRLISNMQLNDDDKIQIETCISRYSTPDSFCGFLNHLVYLVENIFRSILGTSDWQMAVNTIHANALEKAKAKNLIIENRENPLVQNLDRSTSIELRNWAANILNVALTTQNQQPEPSEELQQALNQIDLTAFLEIQENRIMPIVDSILNQYGDD
jgi:hypothetical protein